MNMDSIDDNYTGINKMDTENVTLRKPPRTTSYNDITDIFDYDNNSNTTIMSLPDDTNNYTEIIKELNDKIKLLSDDLKSAHEEIENLNYENSQLKSDLKKSSQMVDTYKKLNLPTDIKMRTPLRKKKSSQKEKVQSPAIYTTHKNRNNISIESPMDSNKNKNKYENYVCINNNVINTSVSNKESEEQGQGIMKQDKQIIQEKRKIVILADDQGYKLQQTLQRLTGEQFAVSSYWKSGAILEELLSLSKVEIDRLTERDFVIIIGGMNDKSPYDAYFSVRQFLTKLNNCNIIVSEVPFNRTLNEHKFNSGLRLVCAKFDFVSFVDMNYSTYMPKRKKSSLYKCQQLLKEILRTDYRIQFNLYQKNKNIEDTNNKTFILLDKCVQTDALDCNDYADVSDIRTPNFFRQ